MKAATSNSRGDTRPLIFQSTPPVKAATRPSAPLHLRCRISIHAAREGGDRKLMKLSKMLDISIHAAREGGDGFGSCPCLRAERFQSTPPVKAATIRNVKIVDLWAFQSTPPVKAATEAKIKAGRTQLISIHAAREGGDNGKFASSPVNSVFQSTPPVKAATRATYATFDDCTAFQSTPPVKAATAETNRRNQHFRKQQV